MREPSLSPRGPRLYGRRHERKQAARKTRRRDDRAVISLELVIAARSPFTQNSIHAKEGSWFWWTCQCGWASEKAANVRKDILKIDADKVAHRCPAAEALRTRRRTK